jgi:phospholipid-translocating ATPase
MSPDSDSVAQTGGSPNAQDIHEARRHSAAYEEDNTDNFVGRTDTHSVSTTSRSLPIHNHSCISELDPFADPVARDSGSRAMYDAASVVGPARRALSPLGSGDATLPSHASPPSIPQSGRSRGYSLRRARFNKGMGGASTPPEPIIELGEISPAPSHASRPADSKVPFDAQVDEVKNVCGNGIPNEPRGTISGAFPMYKAWINHASHSTVLSRAREEFVKVKQFILRRQDLPPSKDGRHIEVDATRKSPLVDERTSKSFMNNLITSSRYTVYNFLPRQLIAQFSRIANFYFLLVSILQMIPGLSTTGTYTTIVPLLFFVSLSMAKEGYDDFRRHRLDKEENNRKTTILHAYRPVAGPPGQTKVSDASIQGPIHWATAKWKNVQVGDIVKLERDQAAPADLVVLHTRGENGVAYTETMALDGETNLKSKQATVSLSKCCNSMENLASARAHVVVEDPNLDLYNFEGRVTIDGQTVPLTNLEVIYRGSILRNTSELIGLVVYSGEECKIRMNASKNARIKAPSLQNVVNRIVILICVFVVLLSILLSVGYEIWEREELRRAWYLVGEDVSFGVIIVSFIIMFNTMIPLSLYVSLEIIKVFQMLLLNDIDMYDVATDTPMEARTSTINEELGQISHVFSDKTGTLTDNMMRFRKLSVAGTAWLHDNDIRDASNEPRGDGHRAHRGKGKATIERGQLSTCDKARKSQTSAYTSPERDLPRSSHDSIWKSSARPNKAQLEMDTRELIKYIQRRPHTIFAKKARFFLLSIALCHTCLPETNEHGTISYQAASPDELALVQAAQELGYVVIDKVSGILSIRELPTTRHAAATMEQYAILDVIEFSSKRKRMSVIVRFPDGRICIISKGADSVVMQLLRLAALAKQKNIEIEARATKRKDLEAGEAITRKSHADGPRPSFSTPHVSMPHEGRSSTNLSRNSITGEGRASISLSRKEPLRHQLESWLDEREHDVDSLVRDDTSRHYEVRPSAQFSRPSMGTLDTRSSMQVDEDFELVEEALVIDEPAVIERCLQHINDFSTEGLRTLLYGYRFLTLEEYLTWKQVYSDATTSLSNRQDLIEAAGELIERDLELAGATAIEDKLQQGVPETIEKLRRANIKIWMLTGDKRETAINIGHSCRLIKDYSEVVVLDHHAGHLEQTMALAIVNINRGSVAHSVVVVDGQTLSHVESYEGLRNLFFSLAIMADSVICCRASPSQKAGLVKAIRHRVNKSITLAIGDGANDIAMIQEAHVGIGITGKEGLQAARTSDYSIAQFRFLAKLLLVHGRWNYVRTCKYVVATFWKGMLCVSFLDNKERIIFRHFQWHKSDELRAVKEVSKLYITQTNKLYD